ncbi:MAG: hypothetical protein JWR10_3814, partial [Rubritepida sp.]|nr:hypothetical protein [Rubritepida sp.]
MRVQRPGEVITLHGIARAIRHELQLIGVFDPFGN